MPSTYSKQDLLQALRQEVMNLEGRPIPESQEAVIFRQLSFLRHHFPNQWVPTGVIHEFRYQQPHHAAASFAFMLVMVADLLEPGKYCIWVAKEDAVFPQGILAYGIRPERIIFVKAGSDHEVLWVLEEALRCGCLSAVVGEVAQYTFRQSRRLQLAVERSRVTCFMQVSERNQQQPTTSAARWQVSALPSHREEGLPGVGYSKWQVQLLHVKNGTPGRWVVAWLGGTLRPIPRFNVQPRQAPISKIG